MYELSKLTTFIEKVNASNSSLEKDKAMQLYKDDKVISDFLYMTYNPFIQYNVTSANVKKYMLGSRGAEYVYYEDIYQLFKDLNTRKITGHIAIASIVEFVNYAVDRDKETFYKILDKDLSIRTGATNINKVFKDLIPVFDVALGYPENDCKEPDYENEEWFWSRKLDGLRGVFMKSNGETKPLSRTGKEFRTVQKLVDAINALPIDNVVFDGELCIIDENGDEDFTQIQKEYNKGGANGTHQIADPKLMWFDLLTIEEFETKTSTRTLSERQDQMKDFIAENPCDSLIYVEQTLIKSKAHLEELKESIAGNPKIEGGIARKNATYKGKRSKDILKVKVMTEEEFTVVGVGTGDFKVIEKQADGKSKEVTIQTMTQLFIDYKGNADVAVGSGYSLEQRKEIFEDHSLAIGKEITVSYFATSVSQKTGKKSLRFPTFKALWKNGTRKDTE